jgi:dTDP-4-dehydrorhamnose 3,5-epimerase
MKFRESPLKGAFVIELEPREDQRGFFARTWCQREFEAQGLKPHIVQGNISRNRTRGTLRGLHFQAAPYAESKLVQCVRGAIFDVIVDLRDESPTYRQWTALELTADNGIVLFVPEGFAHGFQTLEDDTDVYYLVTEFYTPGFERGVRWDDPALGIDWPNVEQRVMSDKDRSWPLFLADKATR